MALAPSRTVSFNESPFMSLVWVDRMAVDVRGEGDTVVYVHGLGGSANAWAPLLPAFPRSRNVRIELPGAGRSTRAHALGEATPHAGHISAVTHAQAVVRVMSVLGIERAHLVAHSFGTIISLHVAEMAPEKVRSLTLFGAMAEPVPAQREFMRSRAAVARSEGMWEIAEGISQVSPSASTRETQPVTIAYIRESIAAQDAEGFARNCIALAEAQSARLELIKCPTLIVNGDEDLVTPLSGAKALASKLASARVETLNRCGHWPMFERVTESQRLMREFIERVR
jgi:3-oxoadipate enol-lactonase